MTANEDKQTNHFNLSMCLCVCEGERDGRECLTSVVDSGDGVSIEHAVEEGV